MTTLLDPLQPTESDDDNAREDSWVTPETDEQLELPFPSKMPTELSVEQCLAQLEAILRSP